MNKYIAIITTTLCVVFSLGINELSAQIEQPHLNSRTPSVNRLDARALTLPFSSKAQSVEAIATTEIDTLRSLYINNLNGEWNVQQLPFETPLNDVDRIAGSFESKPTAIPQKTQYSDALMVYTRKMSVPFAWIGRSVILRLGRVSGGCYVYVNGSQVGYSSDSRVAAEFDITQYVNEGANELKLVVYSSHVASELEGYNDPALASIDGDVMLISQPRFRIKDIQTQSYCDKNTQDGVMILGVVMNTNMLNSRTMTLMYELSDAQGKVVAYDKRNVSLEMKGEDTIEFYTRVPNAKMWSSESPNLYTLTLRTLYEGRYLEYISTDFGFRKVAIGDDGLMINDKKVDLRTVEYDPEDKTAEQIAEDIKQLKQAQVNTIVLKQHEPYDWFYSLCSRLGMYVFTRANIDVHEKGTSRIIGGAPANDPAWLNAYKERSLDAYLSSHRHASVIGFILGDASGANGYALYESYMAVKAKSHDRPVVCLQAGAEWNSDMTPAQISSGGRDRIMIGEKDYWISNPRMIFEVDYDGQGGLEVTNLNDFATMTEFDLNYKILVKNRVSDSGNLMLDIAAGATDSISLPIKRYPKKYTLDIAIVSKQFGNLVYAQQFD